MGDVGHHLSPQGLDLLQVLGHRVERLCQLAHLVAAGGPDPASLQAALDQTERLGGLVTYLLDLSRIQAGAVGLDIADVPVAEFLEEAAVAARHIGAQKGVAIRVGVDPPDLTVPADAERLHQVVCLLYTSDAAD